MEPNVRYAFVGLVLVIIVGSVLFTGLWLAGTGQGGDYNFYTIYFRNRSLSGLQVDSNVTMQGIKIGTVLKMQISKQDIEEIRVLIKVQEETPIKTDTRAVIDRNLLTGLASIDLQGSSQGAKILAKRSKGEPYPIIPQGATELEALKKSFPELLAEANNFVRRASAVFSPENESKISKMLSNLELITDRVVHSENQFKATLQTINSLAADLKIVVKNIDSRSEDLSSSVTSTSDAITLEVSNISRDINLLTQNLSSTLEDFDNPRSILSGPASEAFGPGESR